MERSSPWQLLPDCILLHIFSFLNWTDLIHVGLLCRSWCRVSCDEFLWRSLFHLEWNLPRNVKLPSTKSSWKKEFQRLKDCVPVEEVEVLNEHTNQVLHVSFAHDGRSFASCSKDGFVKVWNANYPVTIMHSRDMKEFNWKYTQFSQFNESDTLLLVSGVHPGRRSTLGEIAVFNLEEDFNLQCKVQNRPYDIFGTWYCENYLLSGDFHLSEHLVSSSVVWLNRASQENDSPDKAVVKQLYRFYNRNASSIRTIMVANCISSEEPHNLIQRGDTNREQTFTKIGEVMLNGNETGDPCVNGQVSNAVILHSEASGSNLDDSVTKGVLLDDREKFLIFTTGSRTYTPHQIGFKKISPIHFQDTINVNLKERIAELRERQNNEREFENLPGGAGVRIVFDEIDHYIELHGHIIGMALSPDHRYLYVNSRPWPQGYQIMDPLLPPPIAQEIDIHIIDMTTLKEIGTMLRAHKAYTPNDECFFIFLDVCNDYVASGAEDKHGYLWDRHYSICIAKLPHQDVVNSVAFNPYNEEMLVTASDDFTLKVWRSKHSVRKLKRAGKMRSP